MSFRPLPSQERIKQLLDYCPRTGQLTHKTNHKGLLGKAAGCPRARRGGKKWMILVSIDAIQYPAHRIIWKWMTGNDPPETIDHIDRNPFNNAWDNLRPASAWLQAQNREWDATMGHKGVTFDKGSNKWVVRKTVNRRRVVIGRYEAKEEAIHAMNLFMKDLCEKHPEWREV